MQVIAHRGASSLEPENTVRSFLKAQEYPISMIEFDVRLTRDQAIIISHDASLKRLFGVNAKIAELDLAEIKDITLQAGREMPTLAEALASIKVPVNVEIKAAGLEALLLEQLKNFSSRVVVSSALPGALKKIRSLDENIDLGLVLGRGELHLLPVIRYLTRDLNLSSIHPKYILANAVSIPALRRLNKQIFVWTVNEPHEFERMERLGVDGIFTDCPQIYAKPQI